MTSAVAHAVEFEDFRLAFHRPAGEQVILQGVDLAVPHGGFYLLAGESGSGKSTLLRLFAGLWEEREPAPRLSGQIRVLGVPIRASYPRALRDRVQAVLQEEGLLDELSPRGNVELGLRVAGRSPRLAIALLAQAGLSDPPRQVSALSGGMRKRVAVARALAGEPELLVFDEPTAGLDPDSARSIASLLADTHRRADGERTTIVITHDRQAFGGLNDGVLHLDPVAKTVRRLPPDSAGAIVEGTEPSPLPGEIEDPALRGMRQVVLAMAAFAHDLSQAVIRLPPVYPGIVLRTTARYVLESLLFVVVGCATVGGLATFFALRNNPLEGAFTGAVITGSGKVLVAVLIPLLAGFFFTARIAAGAAARLGTMKRTSQVTALQLMGIRPVDYLLTPLVWAVSLAMPAVTAAGIVMACAASYVATALVSGISPYGWGRAFIAELELEDLRFAVVKTVLSGFLVAVLTFHLAMGPKRSGREVGQAVNSSIVLGIFAVLTVHALLTLVQFG